MDPMVSSPSTRAARRSPAARRAEILDAATRIALERGLESLTIRTVAHELGVRPGLISHYFPAVKDLVVAAFAQAISQERERLIPAQGAPLTRLAHMVARVEGDEERQLARLWLNARHLSRYDASLDDVLLEQEALDRERLTRLIDEGISHGEFAPRDSFSACVRIFVAIDGVGAYVNGRAAFDHDAFRRFVTDVAEWALNIPSGRLREAVDEIAPAGSGPAGGTTPETGAS